MATDLKTVHRSRQHTSRALLPKKYIPIIGTALICILQICIWPTFENIMLAAMCCLGGAIATTYLGSTKVWRDYPLSAISLGGYSLYYFLLPPLVTLMEMHPVSFNLNAVSGVGVHSILGLFSLLLAHVAYRSFGVFIRVRRLVSNQLLLPLGLFQVPTALQAMLVGSIGLLAATVKVFIGGYGVTEAEQGIGLKILQGMSVLMFYPFVLSMPEVFGGGQRTGRSIYKLSVGLYVLPLSILAIMRNSRAVMFSGLASVGVAGGWGLLSRTWQPRYIRPPHVLLAAVLIIAVSGPVSELATAMVIARGQRAEVSPLELIRLTWDAYQDKQQIRNHRLRSETLTEGEIADERYADNLFFARLCNLRYLDISLDLASSMSESQRREIRLFETQKLMSILPRPVIKVLGLRANKDQVAAMSSGDHTLFVVTGERTALGGFRTGSMLGNAFAVFGWIYPLVIIIIAIPTFLLLDTLSHRTVSYVYLSPVCALMLFQIMFHWTSAATGCESISAPFSFLMRGWLQSLLLYWLAFQCTSLAVGRGASWNSKDKMRPKAKKVSVGR